MISPAGRVAFKVAHDDPVFCGGLNEVQSDGLIREGGGGGGVDVETGKWWSGRTSSTPRNPVLLALDLCISIEGIVFLTRVTTPPSRFHIH